MNKISELESFNKLTNFIKTDIFTKFVHLPHQTIGLFTGNQSMKTSSTAYQYVLRILSFHPVPKKNVLYFECEDRERLKSFSSDKEEYDKAKKEYLEKHDSLDSATFTLPLGMGDGTVNEKVARSEEHTSELQSLS